MPKGALIKSINYAEYKEPEGTNEGTNEGTLTGLETLESMGYKDFEAVIEGWRERSWLDDPDPKTYTKVMKVGSEAQRLVVIRREAVPDMNTEQEDEDPDF